MGFTVCIAWVPVGGYRVAWSIPIFSVGCFVYLSIGSLDVFFFFFLISIKVRFSVHRYRTICRTTLCIVDLVIILINNFLARYFEVGDKKVVVF